ncbi:hypothetical protein BPAE_0340g00020 [Botrytis paeoniae]|uniref:FAD-binding PCMH-type domain-containing protein n=1 Tax=Botrytis paeoniae TaxID=278948 RepID=A0A4Z1FDN5_9HELO|nr:hypothetical protein BPAE_0340g00020 [Botrytis paeoniae]
MQWPLDSLQSLLLGYNVSTAVTQGMGLLEPFKNVLSGYNILGATPSTCRCMPEDDCWPGTEVWTELNKTVGGRLIAMRPATMLGAVCHDPQYNQVACEIARKNWNECHFHHTNPASFMMPYFQNRTCDPFTSRDEPCVLGHHANYLINISGPADITAGLKFANEKNVRLVIKNTGHDYSGKSTGRGALSLWTHHLKTLDLLSYNSPSYRGSAIKLGAGIQSYEAYPFANSHGLRIIGGECPTVGLAGGYTAGGGHSPLSSKYGLAADSVLSWEIVIANGTLLTASQEENSDLYWALSGGGAGTWGVVTSMIVKVYPEGPVSGAFLTFSPEEIEDTAYWDAVEAWHASLPDIVDAGAMALYAAFKNSFRAILTVPDYTSEETQQLLNPFLKNLVALKIPHKLNITYFQTYFQHFETYFGPLPFGWFPAEQLTNGRLIPRSVVLENNKALRGVTRSISNTPYFGFAGIALNVNHSHSGINSVHPAWRDTLISASIPGIWNFSDPLNSNEQLQKNNTEVIGRLLKSITPGGGTYLNEADFLDPDWKDSFYGKNYQRLSEIKSKYDPNGLFYATTAVGSDEFKVDDMGRVCKA